MNTFWSKIETSAAPLLRWPRGIHSVGVRLKIFFASLMVVCLAIAAWTIPREHYPVYQGKALPTWLADWSNGLNQVAITQAVRHIGTNGIPTMLGMLGQHDFSLSFKVLDPCISRMIPKRYLPVLDRYKKSHMDEGRSRRSQALNGFRILGSDAQPAVSELMKLYKQAPSADHRFFIGASLAYIGATGAVPLLLADIASTNPIVRLYAVDALALFETEPGIVVPELQKLRSTDTDFRVRGLAGLRLMKFRTTAHQDFSAPTQREK